MEMMVVNTQMSNIGRCERCGSFLIEEQQREHKCEIPFNGCKTIFFDWIGNGFTDKVNDKVIMAKGLDGRLYSLIECSHNPPHSLESRLVTAIKRPEDETEPQARCCQVLVWWVWLSKTVWWLISLVQSIPY
jgi:hypothetical protein